MIMEKKLSSFSCSKTTGEASRQAKERSEKGFVFEQQWRWGKTERWIKIAKKKKNVVGFRKKKEEILLLNITGFVRGFEIFSLGLFSDEYSFEIMRVTTQVQNEPLLCYIWARRHLLDRLKSLWIFLFQENEDTSNKQQQQN